MNFSPCFAEKNRRSLGHAFHPVVFIGIKFLLLALVFISFSLSCYAQNHTPDIAPDPRAVVVWTGFESRELETLEQISFDFKSQTGIDILLVEVPFYEMKAKFIKETQEGNGPDIIICPHDWTGEMVMAGSLAPLHEKDFNSQQQKNYNPVGIEAVSYNGKLYGIPFFLETTAIIYNKTLIPQPPQSLEELMKTASSVNKPHEGKYGFLCEPDNLYVSWSFFSAFGSEIFGKDEKGNMDVSKVLLDSPSSLEALSFLSGFKKDNLITKEISNQEMMNLFLEGRLAFCIDGPWALKTLRRSFVNFGIMELPPLENGNKPKPLVGVYSFMLSSCGDKKENAVKFIHFINTPQNQKTFCSIGNRIPARLDTLNDMTENQEIVVFARSSQGGVPIPNHPAMNSVWEPMKKVIKSVVFQGEDPKQALTTATEEIQKGIKGE